MDGEEEAWSDAEVCVWVGGRRRWVSGVRNDTTCADLVRALLLHTPPSQQRQGSGDGGRSLEEEWVITERWRSVEQPLAPNATILDIWNAWGDAQSEIRFSLRYVESSGDSGCGSPPRGSPVSSRRRRPRHSRLLPGLLRAQGDTLHHQARKLREQDQQIDQLEEQAHRTRMAKHGPNYLLESYLRDIAKHQEANKKNDNAQDVDTNKDADEAKTSCSAVKTSSSEANDNQARSSEATDSPAGNSDSGVGVSGSPQRPTKRRSRGRHLLREHYLTKELADICQINSNRLVPTKPEDNSENSSDELSRVQQQIDILEKLAIINKRLQREEELMVRLGAKMRRYLSEDQISYIENEEQIVDMLGSIRKQMESSSKEIESTAIEMEKASDQLEKRKKLLDDLCKELEEEELEKQALEVQLNRLNTVDEEEQYPQHCNDNVQYNVSLDVSKNQYVDVNYNFNVPNYPLDTLV
ncbi:uncharacterized protein LOC143919883 [Arctopsyche grandis]|uniref:uncharacterized protein LOC143919883 n=1 Tax=Arctopsyche grandis TaxID=121162 RepID=UPI00406D9A96